MKIDINKLGTNQNSIQIGTSIIWLSYNQIIAFRHRTEIFILHSSDSPSPSTTKHIGAIPVEYADKATVLSRIGLDLKFRERFYSIL